MSVFKCAVCDRKFSRLEGKYSKISNKCILHCNKESWYKEEDNKRDWSSSIKNVKFFWFKVHQYIKKPFRYSSDIDDYYDFSFVKFPTFTIDKKNVTKYCKLNKLADFSRSIFLDNAKFSFVTFEKEVDFNDAIFHANVSFAFCKFNDIFYFQGVNWKTERLNIKNNKKLTFNR